MTFGRWLLIHSLSISIVVMLGVGYLFKEELKLSEAYNQLLLIDRSELVISNDVTKAKDAEIDNTAQEKSKPASNKTVNIRKPSTAELSKSEALKSNFEQTSELNVNALADNQKTLNNSQIEAKTEDYLLKAREAYWDKNYPYAIELYSAEIAKNPRSADLYGELGNIYYSLNNYDTASIHYLKAGELFILNREEMRAKQVYDILISIAPMRAEMLLQLRNQQHQ